MLDSEDSSQATWTDVEAMLMRWSNLGVEKQRNGTCLIARVPDVAPLAWLHEMYSPLSPDEINALELRLGRRLPDEYRRFLEFSNGLNAFSDRLKIFGMPRSRNRFSPSAREPYDLPLETLHTRALPSMNLLCFGGVRDEFLYCDWKSDKSRGVFASRKSAISKPTRSWPGFWEMLRDEVATFSASFDEWGRHRGTKS